MEDLSDSELGGIASGAVQWLGILDLVKKLMIIVYLGAYVAR
ncbi:hypothetical protein MIDIC_240005 [Alphaproteobacteria bacterium]